MASPLTILICTHNRAELLERVLASINAAIRPAMAVEILVAANACTDDTASRMRAYQAKQTEASWLPLRLIEVPTPGKSHALNRAIPEIDSELTALVDDDHRIDANYLVAIEHAAQAWSDAGLFCGRILPDWDGSEPPWVHDDGPYRIYPLPVPRYDQGDTAKRITVGEGPLPGGGNLIVRRHVFELTGPFSTELGPQGHDLAGGEDSEYVLRALTRGVGCQYVPGMMQYHYVDTERLKLGYLLRKSFQRTRSTARIDGNGRVPLYMWRKLAEYGFRSTFALSWAKRRFYWVRTAAALGEIRGRSESGHRKKKLKLQIDRGMAEVGSVAIASAVCGVLAWFTSDNAKWMGVWPAASTAALGSAILLTKSLASFSQTGPRIRQEILTHYRQYTIYALARLTAWAFALMLFTGGIGVLHYFMLVTFLGMPWSPWFAALAASLGIVGSFTHQFIRKLRYNPGLLVASMNYSMRRLYGLWKWATPARLAGLKAIVVSFCAVLLIGASWQLVGQDRLIDLIAMWAGTLFMVGMIMWAEWQPEALPPSPRQPRQPSARPNILMIGSDTLRSDRLGVMGYRRNLTPNLDLITKQGTLFSNCYVPCARTAPSLISLLTGCWPHTHGIHDNFVSDKESRLRVDALPHILKPLGYQTAAVSDWCGADLGKFSFGFDYTDLPEDQWNIKYFIRQGPKDLRLYLSVFLHNRLGRLLLPELYYLGGVPLSSSLSLRSRRLLSRLAIKGEPFLLNVFFSTTHPPFASEWPWYVQYADKQYAGESKFAMSRLTDPIEILRRQGAPKEEFDLDQIEDLYDGCVASFDNEVGKILDHLESCGLKEETIVVVYSDHGMEFFEHGSWGQGNSAIGEASPRVPLLIRDPRQHGRGRVDKVVRSIDLAPTLLELVGIAKTTGSMDGLSLANFLVNKADDSERCAFNETGIWLTHVPGLPESHLRYPDLIELIDVPDRESGTLAIKTKYLKTVLAAKDRMIRLDRWKLVYQPLEFGHALSLFDLETDPNCLHDISQSHPEQVKRLLDRLNSMPHWAPLITSPTGQPDRILCEPSGGRNPG